LSSGQFDKHTKTEGEEGLLSERTFHDAVTLGFEDLVEAFEKQVDDRITELAIEEFANHPDGLIPGIIVLGHDNDAEHLEVDEVVSTTGEQMFDLGEHEGVFSETSLVASYYPNAGFDTRVVTIAQPDRVADLPIAGATE